MSHLFSAFALVMVLAASAIASPPLQDAGEPTIASACPGRDQLPWDADLHRALAAAQEQGRLVLLFVAIGDVRTADC